VLAHQLSEIGSTHQQSGDAGISRQLASLVPQLYTALCSLPHEELQMACMQLQEQPCIWVGRGFAQPGRVAFSGAQLAPWLYSIPAELSPFRELLVELGVRDSFTADQYVQVLLAMGQAAGRAQPLPEEQLAQALDMVQRLADLALPAATQILVPDADGILVSTGDLAYNDAPWLWEGSADGGGSGMLAGSTTDIGGSGGAPPSMRLVHPKISNSVAAKLGVASLRRMLLAQSADSMALGMHSVEAFGQSEALTTRLKHIIQDYPEGPGTLMEMVQNADDAGATKVSFLLDLSSHAANSIPSPAMAMWQGPALLCYNDAMFSPSDFHNISRIGQDSKMARPTSIGRFGLGFNSVYHWTDLPSFVSGEYLVMFGEWRAAGCSNLGLSA
jgi:sacsin